MPRESQSGIISSSSSAALSRSRIHNVCVCVCVRPGALQYLILPLVITRLESDTPTPRLLFPSRPPVFSSSSYVYVLRTLIARNNYATITNGKLRPFITDFNYTKDSYYFCFWKRSVVPHRVTFSREAARPSSLRPTFDPSRNISGSDLLTLDPYLSPLSLLSLSFSSFPLLFLSVFLTLYLPFSSIAEIPPFGAAPRYPRATGQSR